MNTTTAQPGVEAREASSVLDRGYQNGAIAAEAEAHMPDSVGSRPERLTTGPSKPIRGDGPRRETWLKPGSPERLYSSVCVWPMLHT